MLFLPVFLFAKPGPLTSQYVDKPFLTIDNANRYGNGSGLMAFPSTGEPKISIYAHKTSGAATLEIYTVSLEDILTFLTHDKKYNQLSSKINSSNFTHVSDVKLNLTENENTFTLPINSTGMYFIRIRQGDLNNDTFVIRSSIGILAREAKSSLVTWTQDFTTGRSVVGAKISLYNLENKKSLLIEASTDNDGIASVPLTESADLIVVESNNSLSIMPLNLRYLNYGSAWTAFNPQPQTRKYFVFTDRPIYQPGDTVRFKAIVRDDDDARYTLSRGSIPVAIGRGYDSKSFIYKNTYQIDSNGFIAGSYQIPKTAAAGEYRLIINPRTITSEWGEYQSSDDSIFYKVEHYRKPEYFVEADSAKMEVIRGDDININLKGAYYSGQPLAEAEVQYRIFSDRSYYGDSDYYYHDSGTHYYRGWYGSEISSGTVTLDKKGKAAVSLPTNKNDSQGRYQAYYVEFTYADSSGNQTLSGINVLVRSGEFSVYRNNYGVYGGKTGQKLNIPLLLKSNRPGLNLTQKIEINVVRRWWEKTQDNNSKYPQYKESKEDAGNFTITTNSSGEGLFEFTPAKEGTYDINTKLTDTRSNIIAKTFSVWVNDQYVSYGYRPGQDSSLRVNSDKKSYQIGDKALLTLNSDIPDRDVYIGIERGYQDRYQVVRINGKSATFELPIVSHDQPNIFVVAKSFDSDDLAGDVLNLPVDTSNKKLTYVLTPDKVNYAPGDEVTVNISARDSAGNPAESNFALWAVDKSIYALADVNYGDVFDNFWQARDDNTMSAHSLEGIANAGGAEKGGCFLPGTAITLADGSTKNIEEIKVGDRILTHLSPVSSKMVDTRVSAVHHTSAAGYLIINSRLRLTENHLLLVNGTWVPARTLKIGDTLQGVGDKEITVSSLEYLNLSTLVYNLTTDIYHTFIADGVYVHNDKGGSPRDKFADTAYWNASVNTNSQGVAQLKFKLPDNLTTWVLTTIGASADTKAGQAFTEIKVSKDLVIRPVLPNLLGEDDTIDVAALVNNFTDLESRAEISLTTDAGEIDGDVKQVVDIKAQDFSEIRWRLKVGAGPFAKFTFAVKDDHGRSDSIVQNLDIRSRGYLEQSSTFVTGSTDFNLSVPASGFDSGKTVLELNLSSSVLGSLPSAMKYLINYPYGCIEQTTSGLLPKLIARKYPVIFADALKNEQKFQTIEDGLAKLESMQNSNGSWGWWWQDSNPDIFVTAYVFRILNEARNLKIAVPEGMYNQALEYLKTDSDKATAEEKIAKAYGLSFAQDPKFRRPVEVDFSVLNDDYLAMAVYANISSGLVDADKNGLNILISRAKYSGSGVHWQAGSKQRFGSVDTTTALVIQALVKSGTQQELTAKAVNYLMQNRRHDYWSSTYATAQTILAVTDYSAAFRESETSLTYKVISGSTVLASGNFTGAVALPRIISLDPDKIANNPQVRVESSGDGNLYSTLVEKWWVKSGITPPSSNGVVITKTIVNDRGEEYNFTPGDLVRVRLDISYLDDNAQGGGHAVIEDHLPAGLVPVNTNLLNESNSGDGDYSRKEFLKDGVIIPVYYGSARSTYSYLARVINVGNYHLPSAYYSQMYNPDIWARSQSAEFTVEGASRANPVIRLSEKVRTLTPVEKIIRILALMLVVSSIAVVIFKNVKKAKNHPPANPPSA